jgi:leucine-rich repeat protein SHOC2
MKHLFPILFFALLVLPAEAQLLDPIALDTMRTFRSLERALQNPDQVYRLDLSGQKLKEVPEDIRKLRNLNHLDLGNNRLKSRP